MQLLRLICRRAPGTRRRTLSVSCIYHSAAACMTICQALTRTLKLGLAYGVHTVRSAPALMVVCAAPSTKIQPHTHCITHTPAHNVASAPLPIRRARAQEQSTTPGSRRAQHDVRTWRCSFPARAVPCKARPSILPIRQSFKATEVQSPTTLGSFTLGFYRWLTRRYPRP